MNFRIDPWLVAKIILITLSFALPLLSLADNKAPNTPFDTKTTFYNSSHFLN